MIRRFVVPAFVLAVGALAASAIFAASGTITSPAGANTFCGDTLPAAGACLNLPVGIAFDTAGNLYVADNSNQRLRKVTAGVTPTISTYAGNGQGTFCGDAGAATSGCLQFPIGVVADGANPPNVYVADSTNNRVRKISPTGVITTFAGSGVSAFCGDNGPATSACFSSPRGLALNSAGDLFIADSLHNRIRVVNHTTNIITTFAGSGVAGYCGDTSAATSACLNHPRGIKFDSAGNLFIADENNNRIRRVDAITGTITTVAGAGATGYAGDGGAAALALLSHPRGIAFDSANDLIIADSDNDRVRKVVTGVNGFVDGGSGEAIATIAGSGVSGYCGDGGAAASACVNSPDDLAYDASGNLYIAAALNHRIRVVDHITNNISTFAGSSTYCGDTGLATAACLNNPQGVERHAPTDPLYIADTGNHVIRVVNGTTITTFAGTGTPGYSGDNGPAAAAQLYSPRGLSINAAGDLYIADTTNNRIRRIDHATHNITTVAGTGAQGYTGDAGAALSATLNLPRDVFIDAAGDLYIADTANNVVRMVTPGPDGVVNGGAGETITTVAGNGGMADCVTGSPATTTACLNVPNGIFVDGSGLLIADTGNQKVKLVSGGTFTTIAGTGAASDTGDAGAATSASIHEPSSAVKDSAGNVFISSHSGDRIREITGGIISTVVGSAVSGFCGDGGAAASACLTLPRAIALDTGGNLYIADQGNRRIRMVDTLGAAAPAATPTSVPVSSVGGIAEAPDIAALHDRAAASDGPMGTRGWITWLGLAALGVVGAAVWYVRFRAR
jgi:sugar lactone lactonase YvrE